MEKFWRTVERILQIALLAITLVERILRIGRG